ncbi:MAG: 50S ribosomal protein L19 [Chloroflexi bacterium]|nr:50S ribosomal protein L19 [Chloroflexota bacterium]
MVDFIRLIEEEQLRHDLPEFGSGDTVRVSVKVVEGGRQRVQPFEGVVMRSRGSGSNANFTVRRITHGVEVERTFLLHSPTLEKIEVLRHGKVRRAQLYYLRGRSAKASRTKEKRTPVESK